MNLRILDNLEQGSPEWHDQRRGMVTASVVGQLLTVGHLGAIGYNCPACEAPATKPCRSKVKKAGETGAEIKTIHPERTDVAAANRDTSPPVIEVADNDTSRGLIALLVAERVTGETEESYINRDMERGIFYEATIRDRYAEVNGVEVKQVGFAVRTFPGGAQLGASPDGLVGDEGGIEIKAPRAKGHVGTVIADEVPSNYMPQVQASLLVTGRAWWDYVQAAAGRLYVKRVYPDPAWHAAITAAVIAAERAIEQRTSEYLTRAESLPTIAPYVNPFDLEVI